MSDKNLEELIERQAEIANKAQELSQESATAAVELSELLSQNLAHDGSFFITGLSVFILACFVGYYVVWRVTPALHSPLMGITNAISSVIIVGALIAAGPIDTNFAKVLGFFAVVLASINIFGGFIVTNRMLSMFKKKGA